MNVELLHEFKPSLVTSTVWSRANRGDSSWSLTPRAVQERPMILRRGSAVVSARRHSVQAVRAVACDGEATCDLASVVPGRLVHVPGDRALMARTRSASVSSRSGSYPRVFACDSNSKRVVCRVITNSPVFRHFAGVLFGVLFVERIKRKH